MNNQSIRYGKTIKTVLQFALLALVFESLIATSPTTAMVMLDAKTAQSEYQSG